MAWFEKLLTDWNGAESADWNDTHFYWDSLVASWNSAFNVTTWFIKLVTNWKTDSDTS